MNKEQLQKMRCDEWAKKGVEFSQSLYSTNIAIYNNLRNKYSYISIANAIALTWTKHAIFDEAFI